jgi:hypothetical protein
VIRRYDNLTGTNEDCESEESRVIIIDYESKKSCAMTNPQLSEPLLSLRDYSEELVTTWMDRSFAYSNLRFASLSPLFSKDESVLNPYFCYIVKILNFSVKWCQQNVQESSRSLFISNKTI